MLLVAPTEHAIQVELRNNLSPPKWKISSLPEKHGCDILSLTKAGVVGFQRKTLPDLVASLQDGRLYYELGQLNASGTVAHSFLIIESNFYTTTDDHYTEADISVGTLHSIVTKFHVHGIGYLPTSTPSSTIDCCISVSRYLASGNAWAIHRPKNVTDGWGQTTNKSYGIFLLQSFPGIGPKVAEAIYDHFSGVPLAWTITPADLAQVPGIGRKRAEALMAALSPHGPAVRAAGPDHP
jgi:DNA excision repair protein ERCC-4